MNNVDGLQVIVTIHGDEEGLVMRMQEGDSPVVMMIVMVIVMGRSHSHGGSDDDR